MKYWLKNKKFCENNNYINTGLTREFQTVLHKSTGELVEKSTNTLNHSFGSKSLYHYMTVTYDTETMLAKLDKTESK